ncbi:SCO family protein [Prosthecobacter vanneervenii]|uniref:Cytochrome oxidase Cu insertion factor (SCO1/SenC/PrrC family) n=1 Tax=Prosthecobacter vanneervenii TaxID=48466 RepID=A0A7W8DIZ4_9BACT|nr:SCO family protein [Prosthecobacter vanneervenii]MBB5031547.1 cytochrome oxidase Cu insertion factor (SCO1/SenC/PrrC family) [Prosthecobacter vanneervenii]
MPSYSPLFFKRFQLLLGLIALTAAMQHKMQAAPLAAGDDLQSENQRLMRRGYGDKLPDIPLVDQHGRHFRLFSDLIKDKAVIISFFYTNCEDACPVTNSKLAQMRKELKKSFGRSIQILSITVDSARDTPEKIARYARMQKVETSDPDMPDWKFLTGDAADILKVRETIGLVSNDITRKEDSKPSAHGTVLVVGNQSTGRWTLLSATGPMEQNMERLKRIAGWTQQVRYEEHRKSVLETRSAAAGQPQAEAAAAVIPAGTAATIPVLGKLTGDLTGVERAGRGVRLSELSGKVTVLSQLYTVCPHGSKAVIAAMRALNEEFGGRADFHQLSMSAASERETPEYFRSYAEGIGVGTAAPWWFVTVERPHLHAFAKDQLGLAPARLIPEEERLNTFDLYENDLRLVLLDRQGQVRGRYQVFHPDPDIGATAVEMLRRDVRHLLNEPAAAPLRNLDTASLRP